MIHFGFLGAWLYLVILIEKWCKSIGMTVFPSNSFGISFIWLKSFPTWSPLSNVYGSSQILSEVQSWLSPTYSSMIFFFGELLMFWCSSHDGNDEGFVIGCLWIQILNFVLFAWSNKFVTFMTKGRLDVSVCNVKHYNNVTIHNFREILICRYSFMPAMKSRYWLLLVISSTLVSKELKFQYQSLHIFLVKSRSWIFLNHILLLFFTYYLKGLILGTSYSSLGVYTIDCFK